jgi:hypothetical protein
MNSTKEDVNGGGSTSDHSVISMQEFLKFLKISVNVNDSLDKHAKSSHFNFDSLSRNDLVNNLMRKYKSIAEISGVKMGGGESSKDDDAKKRKRSAKLGKNISLKSKVGESCDHMFPNLNPNLTEKLEEVLSQGVFSL